jgi:ADP-ribose pyrophosphatase YjhB (NUDIX family)
MPTALAIGVLHGAGMVLLLSRRGGTVNRIGCKVPEYSFFSSSMNFCSECGHAVALSIPEGDNRPRHVCTQCGTIHYQNPKMVIGSIPVWDPALAHEGTLQVLLCRRAIEPRLGYWTLPAGFMENGETTGEAAVRETEEEAGANIELGPLFTLLNVAHVHQVHMFYLARLLDLDFAPGEESLEVQLFTERDIPWDELAFPTIRTTLELFFADRVKMREGVASAYGVHSHDIRRPMLAPREPD